MYTRKIDVAFYYAYFIKYILYVQLYGACKIIKSLLHSQIRTEYCWMVYLEICKYLSQHVFRLCGVGALMLYSMICWSQTK